MNKYILLSILLVAIIIGGALYRTFLLPEIDKPITTGVERDITIVVNQNSWTFEPDLIEIDQGDKVNLTVVNLDDYDHGFAIDAFGISQRMPALETISISFVATKAGDFPYYCSVSCGSGVYKGKQRGHFDQIGRLHVRDLVNGADSSSTFDAESGERMKEQARQSAITQEANRSADELGYNLADYEITFDEGDVMWQKHVSDTAPATHTQVLNLLADIEHHTVVYSNKKDNAPSLWVFINAVTGEIITHEE